MQRSLLSAFIGLVCALIFLDAAAQCPNTTLISSPSTFSCTQDVTYTVASSTSSSFQWIIVDQSMVPGAATGVLIAGSLTSGTSKSITVRWTTPGTALVACNYQDSTTPTCRTTAVPAQPYPV